MKHKFLKILIVLIIIFLNLKSYCQWQLRDVEIGVFGSPALNIFKNTENIKYSQNINYSAGLFIVIKFIKNFDNISFRIGYFHDNKNYKELLNDTISWHTKSANIKFSYSNIPILFDYNFNLKKKLEPFISAGFIFGHVIKQEMQSITNNGVIKNEIGSEWETEMNPKFIHFSLGVSYKINNKFSLRCEPYLKYYTNGNSFYNLDNDSKISIGTRIEIYFKIYNNA